MRRIRDKSLELEESVLAALRQKKKPIGLPAIEATSCEIVCPEYRKGAEQLDHGEGWHDLPAADQRACQVAFATLELQRTLCQITGQRIPILKKASGKRTSLELRALGDGREDGFEIKRDGTDRVILRGSNPRSLLYAVYHFLECQGCRWYGLGAENQRVPQQQSVYLPRATSQSPSFPLRFFHAHLENRASAAMLDWFGKNRLNLWGADNDRPGQRSRGLQIYGGNHWLIHRAGFEKNFDISDPEQQERFLRAVVQLAIEGHYRDVDYIDYIGEDWGKRVDSPGMRQLGTPSDQDVFLLAEIQKALDRAHSDGRLNRKVGAWGWAYFDTISPPRRKIPEGFAAHMGVWSQFDPRFSIDDPASRHHYPWPHRVTADQVEYTTLPSNLELWKAFTSWPCPRGVGDYHAMARNFFLPAPFVTLLADALPKLAREGALYYSFMHLANGFWGLMQPFYYLMARLLWNANTDVAFTLAEMLRDQFGSDAPAAARCLFSMERAMLPTFWLRSHVAKRLPHATLQDLREPFWIWREHFPREELLQALADLTSAQRAIDEMADSPRVGLWREQIAYADAMQRLYFHSIETYEAARKHGLWHFSREAAEHFNAVIHQLRRLASANLPVWSRNVHYYPRSLMEQTLIGPALERMSANLGIPLPEEITRTEGFGVSQSGRVEEGKSRGRPRSRRARGLLCEVLWTHGGEARADVGLGNYQWAQPYVGGERVYVTGIDRESSPHRSMLRCLDLNSGTIVWQRTLEDSDHSAMYSTYLGVERAKDGRVRSLFVRECHANSHRPSALVRVAAETGEEIWRVEDRPEWPHSGNGAALVLDLDGDGQPEVVDSAVAHVAVLNVETGRLKWRYNDHVRICHGITAAADVDGDGSPELVIGGEYNEVKGTSSLIALRNDGSIVWKSGGHPHDLGSTAAHAIDVDADADGHAEILHCGIDLLGQGRLPYSDLYCWNGDGTLRYRAAFGGREASIADFDGDGHLEVIGITSGRDGGYAVRPAIVCLEAATGKEKWRNSIRRHYLDDDQRVIADFDGDGLPEALLITAHPSGYGHVPGQPTWCDAYIVKGSGRILWQAALEDLSYAALIGTPEKSEGLILASGKGLIKHLSV